MIAHAGIVLSLLIGFAPGAESRADRQAGQNVISPASPEPQPQIDHAQARATIAEVLARPEFANLHSDPYAFTRRLMRWIISGLDALTSALRRQPAWVFWLIITWMVVALLAILAHLVYTLWRVVSAASGVSRSAAAGRRPQGELLGIRELEFEPVYAEALRLLAAGDWLTATKYLYVAAILWLHRQGWISFRPSKTNRDYLAELRARPKLQSSYRRLTEIFEPVVYGGQPATITTTHDIANTVESLLHEPARAVAR
jgi:hypothetical protein